jgi:UDPglucose--hexose-1-phosphate uridylyltransferase
MSEIRRNVVTQDWVIICPERARRPHDRVSVERAPARPPRPARDPACPFCPDNEEEPEIARVSAPDGSWLVRVVPNRYPALEHGAHLPSPSDSLRTRVAGYGAHEVIVDGPRHDLGPALLPPAHVTALLGVCRDRYHALAADPAVAQIVVFKNHGEAAGTSLAHPHSQIVATPVVSLQVEDRVRAMREHAAATGECVVCRMIADDLADGARVVEADEHFVALIPFAALSRFHTWIIPRRHSPAFGDVTDVELPSLAGVLGRYLARLHHGLGDPDLNYVVRSAPRGAAAGDFHWYLSIVPRTANVAGFELGSGMYINDMYPEEAAAFLRGVTLT